MPATPRNKRSRFATLTHRRPITAIDPSALRVTAVQEGPSGRLHSLDNLRAVMMWLGIVLHAAVNHITVPIAAIPWRDRAVAPAADLIFIFIHSFRMPVFFIVAGFFVALLARN